MSAVSKKLAGDPAGLARESGQVELERCKKNLEEALSAGSRLLDDAFKNILAEYEQKLQIEFHSIQDSLKGVRARLDTELRSRIAQKEREFVERVLAEVKARIAAGKREEWYREFMSRAFSRLAEEAKAAGGLKVWVSRDDIDLARELIEKLGNPPLQLAPEPADITGGVIARDETGSINIDYSVDTILKIATLKLQAVILKSLRERERG